LAETRPQREESPGLGNDGGVSATEVYSLGISDGESSRLQRQAEELQPESTALLDRVGLRSGDRAIDLGCGPRGVIDLLWARVSPGGHVVGLDADPRHVAMARAFADERGLDGVEIVAGDARETGLPSGSFEVVHGRTLLITIPRPSEVVAEMVRLARPGGWVVGLEPDVPLGLCYPTHPAYERLAELFPVVFGRNGADWAIGRKMAELYRNAGLEDVQIEARAALYPPGHTRRTIRADLIRSMRPQIIELGLADADELDRLDAAARAHLEDPNVIVLPTVTFLAWGRKPATA
jgi:ubiquinone/menaquinone biosynthesis C-methylase UbiE